MGNILMGGSRQGLDATATNQSTKPKSLDGRHLTLVPHIHPWPPVLLSVLEAWSVWTESMLSPALCFLAGLKQQRPWHER